MLDSMVMIRNAIRDDNYFIVSRLLKKDKSLLDNIDSTNGWSNLHYSSYHNHYQISELLLKCIHERFIESISETAGRNFSNHHKTPESELYTQLTDEDEIKLTFDKQTVLHTACMGNSTATLKLLLSYFNVCLDQRDNKGLTPTHICCINGFSDCLSILLENGAYVDLQDNEGDTPLHKAFQFAHINCLEVLAKFGADDTLMNNVGWKPVDVAYDSDTIRHYKIIKSTSSTSQIIDTDNIKIPQSKYGPSIPLKSPSSSSFSQLVNFGNQESSNRVNLPSILPRKLSLSSMISEDHMDRIDNYYEKSSNSSYKNSSPTCSVNNLSMLPRKNTLTSLQDTHLSKRYSPSQPSSANQNSSNNNGNLQTQISQISPRKSISSNHHSITESPNSKKSSLSTRTFRSNSQTSDLSPIKRGNPMPELTTLKSRPPTPRTSTAVNSRRGSLSQFAVSSHVEEASSKLQDFKLKNVDRLKLDTKLGNIINNSSQEHLMISPTDTYCRGAGSPDVNFEPRSLTLDSKKKSRILSIPILSSRARHNT